MQDNNLFFLPKEKYSLINYVKILLKSTSHTSYETKDGMLFTIDFQSESQKFEFFATLKRNYPELLD